LSFTIKIIIEPIKKLRDFVPTWQYLLVNS
jgi:hypothetical protein